MMITVEFYGGCSVIYAASASHLEEDPTHSARPYATTRCYRIERLAANLAKWCGAPRGAANLTVGAVCVRLAVVSRGVHGRQDVITDDHLVFSREGVLRCILLIISVALDGQMRTAAHAIASRPTTHVAANLSSRTLRIARALVSLGHPGIRDNHLGRVILL